MTWEHTTEDDQAEGGSGNSELPLQPDTAPSPAPPDVTGARIDPASGQESTGPQLPEELRELAERNPGGWVYDVDPKLRGNRTAPPEHVGGAWRIDADGSPSGEYVANPYYRPFRPKRRFGRWWKAAIAAVALLVIAGAVVFVVLNSRQDNPKHNAPSPALVTPRRSTGGASAQPVQLEIVAKSRVWVCLQDASRHVLVNGRVLSPGQGIPRVSSTSFNVYLGNSGVELRLNGKVQPLATSPNPIGYTITQQHLSRVPVGATPCA